MADVGRPSEYDPAFLPKITELAKAGATDLELAEYIGVSLKTVYRWKHEHRDFRHAIKSGKDEADDRIERTLYEKGLAGDTTAMIFWLKNRRSKEWREKSELDVSGLEKLAETIAAARKRS